MEFICVNYIINMIFYITVPYYIGKIQKKNLEKNVKKNVTILKNL